MKIGASFLILHFNFSLWFASRSFYNWEMQRLSAGGAIYRVLFGHKINAAIHWWMQFAKTCSCHRAPVSFIQKPLQVEQYHTFHDLPKQLASAAGWPVCGNSGGHPEWNVQERSYCSCSKLEKKSRVVGAIGPKRTWVFRGRDHGSKLIKGEWHVKVVVSNWWRTPCSVLEL